MEHFKDEPDLNTLLNGDDKWTWDLEAVTRQSRLQIFMTHEPVLSLSSVPSRSFCDVLVHVVDLSSSTCMPRISADIDASTLMQLEGSSRGIDPAD